MTTGISVHDTHDHAAVTIVPPMFRNDLRGRREPLSTGSPAALRRFVQGEPTELVITAAAGLIDRLTERTSQQDDTTASVADLVV
jgi:hypothetical protein